MYMSTACLYQVCTAHCCVHKSPCVPVCTVCNACVVGTTQVCACQEDLPVALLCSTWLVTCDGGPPSGVLISPWQALPVFQPCAIIPERACDWWPCCSRMGLRVGSVNRERGKVAVVEPGNSYRAMAFAGEMFVLAEYSTRQLHGLPEQPGGFTFLLWGPLMRPCLHLSLHPSQAHLSQQKQPWKRKQNSCHPISPLPSRDKTESWVFITGFVLSRNTQE